MDAVTYPEKRTQRFLAERVVAFRAKIDEHQDLAKELGVCWTPGLVWTTAEGVPFHRNVGFFEPDELLAEALLGCGHVAAGQSEWETARARFEEVVQRWPRSHAAPAAQYWAGVAGKKATGEVDALVSAWNELLARYGESAWAMKASFIRGTD